MRGVICTLKEMKHIIKNMMHNCANNRNILTWVILFGSEVEEPLSFYRTYANNGRFKNDKIYVIRGQKVMLDRDVAELYGVETKRLKEQVRRNIDRFPESFMFELSDEENTFLR
jgi:hypothetical protein